MRVRIVRRLTFRENQVWRLRQPDSNGKFLTYQAIGELMGLSRSRVRDMYSRAMASKTEDLPPIEELSERTLSCLKRMQNSCISSDGKYLDLELLDAQINKAIIYPSKIRNFGWHSYYEVKELRDHYRNLLDETEWPVCWSC